MKGAWPAILFAFLIAGIACVNPPKTATEVAAKSALLSAYEARLDLVADQAPTCLLALEAVRAEELNWAPIWAKLNTPPEPPRKLTCR